MIIDYLVVIASITTVSLIWRAILLDHPLFAKKVETLPMVGPSLHCGFCMPVWCAFVVVYFYNPVAIFASPLMSFMTGWLTASAGVLFLRNGIAVLMEANGVLTDKHRRQHERE
jgi:hypothetical protein